VYIYITSLGLFAEIPHVQLDARGKNDILEVTSIALDAEIISPPFYTISYLN